MLQVTVRPGHSPEIKVSVSPFWEVLLFISSAVLALSRRCQAAVWFYLIPSQKPAVYEKSEVGLWAETLEPDLFSFKQKSTVIEVYGSKTSAVVKVRLVIVALVWHVHEQGENLLEVTCCAVPGEHTGNVTGLSATVCVRLALRGTAFHLSLAA